MKRPFLLMVAGLLALVLVAAVLSRPPDPVAAPSAPPSPTPSPATPAVSPTGAPKASPSPMAAGTFADRVLGYRITLPAAYRQGSGRVSTAPGDLLGMNIYTVETEQQAREACMKDAGHIPTMREPPDIGIFVYRDLRRITAQEWALPRSLHHKVEPANVPGYDAARLVEDNANAATTAVVVRADDRVYQITWSGAYGGGHHRLLDDVAKTFSALQPDPFPSPTATVAPRAAADETARALARAFAASDADAVARQMPECWFAVIYAIDGVVPGQGPLNRSVSLFTQALRQRFAARDLTVTVDPALQPLSEVGGEAYLMRSDWRGPDRTRRIDLEIHVRNGRAVWAVARHHFTRAEASCISYGSPWTDSTARC